VKRIKEPPPEFFRFQKWYNCIGGKVERCCVCDKEIRRGYCDLQFGKVYCFKHGAWTESVKQGGGK
jgi:hypothetical protein